MGIVLPDSILGAPKLGYIREWLIKNHRIIASVDLHVDTFQPRNGTQKLPTHKDNISNYRSSSIEKATDSELFRVSGFSLKTRLHSGTIYVYKRNFP